MECTGKFVVPWLRAQKQDVLSVCEEAGSRKDNQAILWRELLWYP